MNKILMHIEIETTGSVIHPNTENVVNILGKYFDERPQFGVLKVTSVKQEWTTERKGK